jgi:hypothetical protein
MLASKPVYLLPIVGHYENMCVPKKGDNFEMRKEWV